MISADRLEVLPTRDRSTYPDDSLGATIIRVPDYCELLSPIATAIHVYEDDLSRAERDDIVRVEQLLAQAVEIINSR